VRVAAFLGSLVVGLVGCGASSEDPPGDDDTDPGLTCTVPADPIALFGEVGHELNDVIPTVVTVRWDPASDEQGWVWFGRGEEPLRTAPSEASEQQGQQALLLGLKPDTTYTYRIAMEQQGDTVCTEPLEVTTGSADPALPVLTLDEYVAELDAGGYTVVPVITETTKAMVTILDRDGDYVWFHDADPLRAWLSIDRKAVLVNDGAYDLDVEGCVERILLDGSASQTACAHGLHTDFVEVEPEVYAGFGWDVREIEGFDWPIAGETILEFSSGQEPRVVWNIFDDFEPDPDTEIGLEQSWDTDVGVWAHLNHLHYHAGEDAYYATARHLDTVYRIERSSGALSWTLGKGGDFQPAGPDPIDFDPHSAVPTDEGLVLFDTGSTISGWCSAVSEFAIDTEAWTADHRWLYATEDCLYCSTLGNSEALWNGNRTLVLSMNGQIDEVTRDGELAWRIRTPIGSTFTYATRVEDLYP